MTGLATGPHLHWELVVFGVNVNPVAWTVAAP
jgi:murein DD-endopeptidase MepM/ murein hydrolase activator NlpD